MKLQLVVLISFMIATTIGCSSTPKHSDHTAVSDEVAAETGAATPKSKKTPESIAKEAAAEPAPAPVDSISSEKYKQLGRAVVQKNEILVNDLVAKNLAVNPNDQKTLNALGVYYLSTDRPLLARIAFRRALEVEKSAAPIYNNVGLSYLVEGDTARAVDEFRRALDLDPGNAIAAANLGALALKFGNYKRAAQLLEIAYSHDKKNEAVAFNYARASVEMGDASAEGILESLIESKNRNALVYFTYGALLVSQKKDATKAKQTLNKVKILTSDPDILRATDVLLKKIGG